MDFEQTSRSDAVEPKRIWVGVVAAGAAWFLLGIAEMFITWRACMHNEEFGNASRDVPAMAAAFAVSFFLLALVAAGGFFSYQTWRKFSTQPRLAEAEGHSVQEFLSLLGIFFSVTLGAGMVWMTLPLFLLRLCARVR
ncbi:MAG TPA: hypothetical protein VMB49_05355 [Acidobacteriaceae bacterium]|nr:hypothetical protein [Acidobacteriaceae bacterium]